jgi:hypothetical protein
VGRAADGAGRGGDAAGGAGPGRGLPRPRRALQRLLLQLLQSTCSHLSSLLILWICSCSEFLVVTIGVVRCLVLGQD